MNGAVDRKAGRVDAEAERIVDHFAIKVDGHKVGSGHFLEAHPIRVDQKAVVPAGKANRDVSVDAVIKVEPVDQSIGSSEVDSNLLRAVVVRRRPGLSSQSHGPPLA